MAAAAAGHQASEPCQLSRGQVTGTCRRRPGALDRLGRDPQAARQAGHRAEAGPQPGRQRPRGLAMPEASPDRELAGQQERDHGHRREAGDEERRDRDQPPEPAARGPGPGRHEVRPQRQHAQHLRGGTPEQREQDRERDRGRPRDAQAAQEEVAGQGRPGEREGAHRQVAGRRLADATDGAQARGQEGQRGHHREVEPPFAGQAHRATCLANSADSSAWLRVQSAYSVPAGAWGVRASNQIAPTRSG